MRARSLFSAFCCLSLMVLSCSKEPLPNLDENGFSWFGSRIGYMDPASDAVIVVNASSNIRHLGTHPDAPWLDRFKIVICSENDTPVAMLDEDKSHFSVSYKSAGANKVSPTSGGWLVEIKDYAPMELTLKYKNRNRELTEKISISVEKEWLICKEYKGERRYYSTFDDLYGMQYYFCLSLPELGKDGKARLWFSDPQSDVPRGKPLPETQQSRFSSNYGADASALFDMVQVPFEGGFCYECTPKTTGRESVLFSYSGDGYGNAYDEILHIAVSPYGLYYTSDLSRPIPYEPQQVMAATDIAIELYNPESASTSGFFYSVIGAQRDTYSTSIDGSVLTLNFFSAGEYTLQIQGKKDSYVRELTFIVNGYETDDI